MEPDTIAANITINGIEYMPVAAPSDDIRICVLERGWVCVGSYETDGDMRRLRKGAVIRVWGTTKGLPELVNGPTNNTKLDKCDTSIEFSRDAEILTIKCNTDGWKCLAE